MTEKRIVILGAGESGVGAAILAKKMNFDVFVSDNGTIKPEFKNVLNKYEINWEHKQHNTNKIIHADEIIKSPGIPDDAEIINQVNQLNIPIISEIEFAARYTSAKLICITGSNGKTTTTLLTYHMFRKAGLHTGLGGNVGQSFAKQVAENNFDYYILELSSFQLDGIKNLKPDIAVLLNITPDHLNRYQYSFQNYIDSKLKIIQNMDKKSSLVYCSDDQVITKELKKRFPTGNFPFKMYPFSIQRTKGQQAYKKENKLIIQLKKEKFAMIIDDLALTGNHNAYNSMASGICGKIAGIKKDYIRESLSDFAGVEHRLEQVIMVRGAMYINDSKATNVNSTWYALESIDAPIVWIAGGVDKGNDYNQLKKLVQEKVKVIICLGKENQKIHEAFGNIVECIDADNMERAVKAAYYFAKKDDNVLLSPACASFDLFKSYEDRGSQFKQQVRNL